MLSHETLENHYVTNHTLTQHHKYTLTELNRMYPFERAIYLDLIKAELEQAGHSVNDDTNNYLAEEEARLKRERKR